MLQNTTPDILIFVFDKRENVFKLSWEWWPMAREIFSFRMIDKFVSVRSIIRIPSSTLNAILTKIAPMATLRAIII